MEESCIDFDFDIWVEQLVKEKEDRIKNNKTTYCDICERWADCNIRGVTPCVKLGQKIKIV